jgi:cell division septation protein DedD
MIWRFLSFSRRAASGRAVACAALLAAAAVVAGGPPAQADMKTAVEDYRQGRYDAAYKEFKRLADAGNPRAQYNLGVMYLSGRGVEQDFVAAAEWHRKAAEQGLAEAQHGLGTMYYRGDGVTQDFIEAAKWFRLAAEQDLPNAQFNMSVMHFNGQGVRKDSLEVVKWISMAAANGQKDAMFRLGNMYEEGSLFTKDKREALRWYRRAAEAGRQEAADRAASLEKEVGEAGMAAPMVKAKPDAEPGDGKVVASDPAPKPAVRIGSARQGPVDASMAEPAAGGDSAEKERPEPKGARMAALREDDAARRNWRVQLAAFRTEAEAEQSWRRLKSRFGDLLAGLDPIVRSAELSRGTYHRLRAGPLESREAAFALCNAIKGRAAKQGCIPIPPGK